MTATETVDLVGVAREAIERHARRNDLHIDLWLATMARLEQQLVLALEVEARDQDEQWADVCECELDWNCGLHRDRMYTAIETMNDEWASREREAW